MILHFVVFVPHQIVDLRIVFRFRDFSTRFNRWQSASALKDATNLVETFDKNWKKGEWPTCFKVVDEKIRFIASYEDSEDDETDEENGDEELQYGFERRKRRKSIKQYRRSRDIENQAVQSK